jgi:[histone H3]-lysine36 N-dimethyltransferase SETMAR
MEKEPYRFYIKTRTLLGINATTIHEELTTAYREEAISYSTVQRWSKVFREGEMELEDDPRSGRPVSKTTEENIQLVRRIIDEDPHSTYDDIEAETQLSHGTISKIIHEYLKMKKVISRWVPHELTPEQKRLRVEICRNFLDKIRNKSWRLCDIFTGDETWIYHRQLGRKASNSCWLREDQSPGTVVKRDQHEPKTLFSIFFRSNGPLIVHSVGKGETVDSFYYIDNCLEPAVKEIKIQRADSGTHGMKLLHDHARAHDAQEVTNYLKQEHINLIPHPPYSPDLSPCDYWLNDYIKRNLGNYNNAKSLHKAVSKIVFNIPQKEYKKTFDKLIERMELCIKNDGNYFEHLMH